MHYYPFNVGDYISHTAHLDPLEDIAYRRMLDWIYIHESPLPNNVEQIAKYIRMRTECERIADVLREYFDLTEYGYEHSRAMKEIAKYQDKSDKAKASARKRWDANALQTECERNANQEPRTNNQEPINNKQSKKILCDTGVSPDRVIEIYNNFFKGTNATQKRLPTPALKQSIKHRSNVLEDESDWLAYFEQVKAIDFLMGLTHNQNRRPFKLTIDWLVKPANLAKVTEGYYHG